MNQQYKNSNKILILALSGIGDALMFTPSIIKLKELLPNSNLEALVMYKGVEDIYKRIPEISKVHYFNFLEASPIDAFRFVWGFRKKYDISINVYPSNRREYNLISLLIGAEGRAGIRYIRKDLQNFGFLNNTVFPENDLLHNVEENIKLVEQITGFTIDEIPPLIFPLNEEDEFYKSEYLSAKNIGADDIVIGFHPGCSTLKNHIKRRWEPEKFAKLAEKLITEYNAKVLIFGGPDETELKNSIVSKISSKNIISVETDNLAHTAAVMKRCNVFVTNDSSLMHTAAALKLKVVAIIGPTSTNYIHPWKTDHKIVSLNLECSPCFFYSPKPLTCSRTDVKFKCIKELDVDMVYTAVKDYLKN